MFFRGLLPFGCLLVPASLIAWFHFTSFPDVVRGTFRLLGRQDRLPVGFELLREFGCVVYLPFLLIVVVGALSGRCPALRGPLSVAVCGAILATVCALYAFLLATPAILYGAFL